ncbi:MAG: elongation factor 1-beta [Candidatus Bathyarchaeota archaeon]|jgi:translation elongation factor aEF-1 beta|nr:elongation factor 1-beta [Candidatus Bathyarchaeota archaeon]HER54665.1 elongation factor 1-beta [Candidatus Bathyarchaeota archaeon]
MGKIIIVYKIFPTESTVNLEEIKEKITEKLADVASIKKFAEEPIAFGLCALKVNMVLPEEEGIADKTEKLIASIEGVGQIQTLGLTRL